MTTNDAGRIAWISIAPVKAMALVRLDEARLEAHGVPGDRAFAVVDSAGRMVNGKRIGPLQTIVPSHDLDAGTLALRFPDGAMVAGDVALGEPIDAVFFSHPRPAHIVEGPWSEALSAWAGQPLRLVAMDRQGGGVDRGGKTAGATLVSTAALTVLARAGGESRPLDGRRFRMTFGIDAIEAYAEEAWMGCPVRVGEAIVMPRGNVGRCAVTTQDPDTGRPTFDTLKTLQQTRGDVETTEPLPFGVWASVVEPGLVRVGDPVGLA